MDGLLGLEFSILNFIATHIRCAFLDVVMPFISWLGDNGMIWIALAFVLLCIRIERPKGAMILLAIVFSVIVCNLLLKNSVARIRPFDVNTAAELIIRAPLDFSFPSGHTSSSFAAATVLMLTHWKGRYAALVLAVLIAVSRLYLYVHYPSDALCGALLGILLGWLAVKAYGVLSEFLLKRKKVG